MLDIEKFKNIDTPARYLKTEARQCIKNLDSVDCRVCLCVPALYEVASFDFDLKDMYSILNNKNSIWCERCFAPLQDFEALLRKENEDLFTLESKTKLKDMDVIIFILSSELMATNMLNMLELGQIDPVKENRKEKLPIVIATGNAVLNPKPYEKFVDAFVIGEMSCVVTNIVEEINKNKEKNKKEILESIKDIAGVYIPQVSTEDIYMVNNMDIDSYDAPDNIAVPSIKTVMDKSIVTLSKGCDKNCVTCLHKYIYRKPEYMSIEKAVKNTKKMINVTGNTDVVLMSNCYGTYPGFPEIIYKLRDFTRPSIKNISFMEVKLNKENLWLLKYMKNYEDYPSIIVGGTTKKIKEKLGIEINDDEVLYVAREVFEAGFTKIRLKYIIGVPEETYEDLSKIIDMANKVCDVYNEVYKKAPDKYIVELNLYTFKPKPHTPSAWCPMNSSENLEIKQKYLREKNTNENVMITTEEAKQGVIETVISRGDESISSLIYEAYICGARHDMIEPMFNYDAWQVAINKTNVDVKKYIDRIDENSKLPWDNIHVLTPKEEIRDIYINKVKGE